MNDWQVSRIERAIREHTRAMVFSNIKLGHMFPNNEKCLQETDALLAALSASSGGTHAASGEEEVPEVITRAQGVDSFVRPERSEREGERAMSAQREYWTNANELQDADTGQTHGMFYGVKEQAEMDGFAAICLIEAEPAHARNAELEAQRDEARRFGEEAAKRYNDLLASGPTLTCAFCGQEYPKGTPPTQHEALTAHVLVCPKHPLAAKIVELKAQARERDEAISHALEAIPRKTWANTARGRGIGGQAITAERDDEYDARIHEQVIRPLQLLLEKHPLIGGAK